MATNDHTVILIIFISLLLFHNYSYFQTTPEFVPRNIPTPVAQPQMVGGVGVGVSVPSPHNAMNQPQMMYPGGVPMGYPPMYPGAMPMYHGHGQTFAQSKQYKTFANSV